MQWNTGFKVCNFSKGRKLRDPWAYTTKIITTMNPSIILESIKAKLINSNYLTVIQEIDDRISAGCTGSEIWASVGHYLIHLEKDNLNAYKLIEKEINELDSYLTSIGLRLLK